jgi:DNA replication protein DnaC
VSIPRYFSDAQLEVLERNPEFKQRGDKCPVCLGDKHYIYQGVKHPCPDDDYGHPMLRLARLYWMSFIPLQYQYLLWDEFPHEDVAEDIGDYIQNFDRMRLSGVGFTIYGKQLGVGKTWAATHILRELVKAGYDGHFASFMSVKSYFELDDRDEREFLIRRVREAEILVLDEVKTPFSEPQRIFFEDKLEDVLRARTNMNFPTIVTSNLTTAEFEREYPRCFSLLAAKNQLVELSGIDARKSSEVWENNVKLGFKGESRPIT